MFQFPMFAQRITAVKLFFQKHHHLPSRPMFSVGGGKKWVLSQFSRTKGLTDEISCCTEIKDIAAHLVLRSQDTRRGSKVSSPVMKRIPFGVAT